MNEAVLHELSELMGGRFRLTTLVQKRLVELMRERSDIVTKNSGGLPVRLVVEEVARGGVQLTAADGTVFLAADEKAD